MRTGHYPSSIAIALALPLGALVVTHPSIILVLCLIPIAFLALHAALPRAIGTILGGIATLQSSSGLSTTKLAYLAFVTIAVLLSVRAVTASHNKRTIVEWRLIVAAFTWAGWVFLSSSVAFIRGNTLSDVFRDAVPYLLLSGAVLQAIDVARTHPRLVNLLRTSALVGTGVSVTTGLTWVDLRGAGSVDVGYAGLSSFSLSILGLTSALTLVIIGKSRLPAGAAVMISYFALALPGTRTNLISLALLPGILLFKKELRRALIRFVGLLLTLAIFALTATPLLASRLTTSSTFYEHRYQAMQSVFHNGVASDQSGRMRIHAYSETWATFTRHPFFGSGPGTLFHTVDGRLTFSLDSPLTTVAKFGTIGTLLLLVLLTLIAQSSNGSTSAENGLPRSFSRAFFLVFLLALPFGGPLEDKGLALAVLLLLATRLTASEMRSPDLPAQHGRQERVSAAAAARTPAGTSLPRHQNLCVLGDSYSGDRT